MPDHNQTQPPATPTLTEVLEGVERAQKRVESWPDWMRELSAVGPRAERSPGDEPRDK
jgi:hypothetical protein